MIKRLVIGLVLPIMLWAWNTDIKVWTKDTMPASYDITIPTDSEMFFTVRTMNSGDTNFIHTYSTTDYGENWTYLEGSFGFSYNEKNYSPTQITYLGDTLFILYPLDNDKNFALIKKEMYNSNFRTVYYASFPLDSIKGIYMTYSKNIAHTPQMYIYVAALGWRNDTVRYSILRTMDLGSTWDTVVDRHISTSTSYDRILKHISSYDYGDSIKLLLVYQFADTGGDSYYLYYSTYMDTFGSELVPLSVFESISVSNYVKVSSALSYQLGVIAYVDTGVLKFIYTSNDWNTSTNVEYPYNSDYNSIGKIDMVLWKTWLGDGGFNLAYTPLISGYQYIYYNELRITSDTLVFTSPVQVSDTSTYTYLFNPSPYYQLKIKNLEDYNSPYIVWGKDYSHFIAPVFYYDSTEFYVDYMNNTQVKENRDNSIASAHLNILMHGSHIAILAPSMNRNALVSIVDLSGRKIMKNRTTFKDGRTSINISSLRNGVYFVIVKGSKTTLKGKFVKIR